VQHELRRRLELSRIPERLVQGAPSGMEQQIVQGLTIAENQAGQLSWQREDDLEVIDLGQYQLLGLLQPIRSPSTTALRAVAIDARIVYVAFGVTFRTLVQTPFQRRRAAEQDTGKDVLCLIRQTDASQKAWRIASQDVDDPWSLLRVYLRRLFRGFRPDVLRTGDRGFSVGASPVFSVVRGVSAVGGSGACGRID